jgi:hypothetical protein
MKCIDKYDTTDFEKRYICFAVTEITMLKPPSFEDAAQRYGDVLGGESCADASRGAGSVQLKITTIAYCALLPGSMQGILILVWRFAKGFQSSILS